jgi:hypothetical protein
MAKRFQKARWMDRTPGFIRDTAVDRTDLKREYKFHLKHFTVPCPP